MLNVIFSFQLIFAFEYRCIVLLITGVFAREYLKSSCDIYSAKLVHRDLISMLQTKLYSKIAEVGNGGFCKAQNFVKE